jgi:hypothetical protein
MPSLALALAALTAAAPADLPGIWEGTVGTLPVRACFGRRDGGDFGGYFYRSKLRHIALEPVEGEPATFLETYSPGEPRWRVERATAGELGGTWSDGRRRLPIRLARVPGKEQGCDSLAFHGPRLAGILPRPSRAAADGTAYTRLVLDPRGRFEASVETFAIDGAGAAAGRINAALREPLGEWLDCVRAPLRHSPYEGSYHVTLTPAMITRRWLSVVNRYDDFCGGVHPNAGQTYWAFDLASGRGIDLRDWFNGRAVKRAGPAGTGEEIKTLQPEFRSFLLAGPRDQDAECDEVVGNEEYWNVGLTPAGLVFAPQLAHAVQACGEEIVVPAARLAPFLTPEGAAYLREIEAERGRPR